LDTVKQESMTHRQQFLQALVDEYAHRHSIPAAKAIKAIIKSEQSKRKYLSKFWDIKKTKPL
jgi:hypothetical protein